MFVQSIIHFPALGKNAELLAAMRERNDAANAAGSPHSISARMFAPEPALIHSIRFDNLAAIETYQARNQADAAFQETARKIVACLSRPQSTELFEVLVRAQPTGPVNFVLSTRLFPAAGSGPELRRLLEERIRAGASGAVGAGLGVQVAPSEGPTFGVLVLFSSLAGLEQFRAVQAVDPAFQAFAGQLRALTVRPARQELLRVIAPFP